MRLALALGATVISHAIMGFRYYQVQGRILNSDVGDGASEASSVESGHMSDWITLYQGRTLRAVLGGFLPGHRCVQPRLRVARLSVAGTT